MSLGECIHTKNDTSYSKLGRCNFFGEFLWSGLPSVFTSTPRWRRIPLTMYNDDEKLKDIMYVMTLINKSTYNNIFVLCFLKCIKKQSYLSTIKGKKSGTAKVEQQTSLGLRYLANTCKEFAFKSLRKINLEGERNWASHKLEIFSAAVIPNSLYHNYYYYYYYN